MYLYLVRHGQSMGNVLRTFHGQTDYPLTETGWAQARQAAEKLREVSFTRCCASDLQRAWNTALCCVEGRGIAPEPCPELREQNVGDIEDLSWEEMGERYPQLRTDFIENWVDVTPPGGESPDQMLERVGRCVDAIIRQGEDTLIAAHNGSLCLTLFHLGLASKEELLDPLFFFRQGYYSAVEAAEGRAKLLFFNR